MCIFYFLFVYVVLIVFYFIFIYFSFSPAAAARRSWRPEAAAIRRFLVVVQILSCDLDSVHLFFNTRYLLSTHVICFQHMVSSFNINIMYGSFSG